jgi:hypothetical protein
MRHLIGVWGLGRRVPGLAKADKKGRENVVSHPGGIIEVMSMRGTEERLGEVVGTVGRGLP